MLLPYNHSLEHQVLDMEGPYFFIYLFLLSLAAMNKPNLIDYRRIFCLEDLNIPSAPDASNHDAFATCDYAI